VRAIPTDELGDRHLVTVGLEDQAADHVREVRAELAAMQRMRIERRVGEISRRGSLELARDLGLAARYDGDVIRARRDREHQRVVGGGVAGVQRGDDVRACGGLVRVRRARRARESHCRDRAGDQAKSVVTEASGSRGGLFGQLGAGLDRGQRAAAGGAEDKLVEQCAEVALASAAIDDRRRRVASQHIVERGSQQADEMPDLLQLAARVLIELTIAREQMQILQQLDRHAFRHIWIGERIDFGHGHVLPRKRRRADVRCTAAVGL